MALLLLLIYLVSSKANDLDHLVFCFHIHQFPHPLSIPALPPLSFTLHGNHSLVWLINITFDELIKGSHPSVV
jgi:hypothetical protein